MIAGMARLHRFEPGGFAFLEGGFPYSQGVVALPGHAIVRARFMRPPAVADGFAAIEAHLAAHGRPTTAFCACELRSPEPFTFEGFAGFNRGYRAVLERWGLVRDGLNPVARSNLAPEFDPPAAPVFHAFAYTVALDPDARPGGADFVVAGSGEWPEHLPFPEGIVARGDLSADGLARKAAYVLDTMRARVDGLGADWTRLTGVQVYTVHDVHPLLGPAFAARGLLGPGLTWHPCRPPIRGLEFEMDLRGVARELVLDVRT
jgi:hypothetical protein